MSDKATQKFAQSILDKLQNQLQNAEDDAAKERNQKIASETGEGLSVSQANSG